MACTDSRRAQVGDLAAGLLSADRAAELLDHIEACPSCSEELDFLASVTSALARRSPASSAGRPVRLRRVLPIALAAGLLAMLAIPPWLASSRRSSEWAELAATEPLPLPREVLRSSRERPPAYQAALQDYAEGRFAEAAAKLASLHGESDALVQLYLGLSLYAKGAPADAEPPLRRAAELGEGLLREHALWYLGHAALAQEHPNAALEVFQRLEALAGDYELNAREKAASVRAALER
jgi:hypothetical protein